MRFHGSVSLALLALATPAIAQDSSIPRLLDSRDRQVDERPPRAALPGTLAPPAATATSNNQLLLEHELEGLRSDLQTFHAVSDDVTRKARDLELQSDRTSSQQRQEVLDLLTKLATQGVRKPKEVETPPQVPLPAPTKMAGSKGGDSLVISDATVDAFALGKVLFKSGDFPKAEQAFRKVTASDDNRMLLKYMIATCQYRQQKIAQAAEGYREIAASNEDPVVRDFAKSQLESIRWRQEFDRQLESLRQQRPGPSGSIPKPDDAHK